MESETFFSRVYDELRRLAAKYESDGIADRSSLVHEAFLKMHERETRESRDHFFAIAATAMRQVLVDRARAMNAQKRGGGMARVSLTGLSEGDEEAVVDILALDEVLTELAELDARQAAIVELRFFGGLTTPQIAERLDVSESTIEKDWRAARDWLGARLRSSLVG